MHMEINQILRVNKLISKWKALHQDSLWNRGEMQLRNCLLTPGVP